MTQMVHAARHGGCCTFEDIAALTGRHVNTVKGWASGTKAHPGSTYEMRMAILKMPHYRRNMTLVALSEQHN